MSTSLRLELVALASLALSAFSSFTPAIAATTFEQQEVDQSKFIAVASPYGKQAHQLLILEQVSSTRPCWQETGVNQSQVDPLLLSFNFTGICGRSTDSNGYSIRMAGQDLGLQYSLRVVKRNGELVLLGVPSRDRQAPTLEIGKTQGVDAGFAKLVLNPGWRLTKRVYNGRVLGHVYLTNDIALNQFQPTTTAVGPSQPTSPPAQVPVTPPPRSTSPVAQPPQVTPPRSTQPTVQPPQPKPTSTPIAQPSRPTQPSGTAIPILVPPPETTVKPTSPTLSKPLPAPAKPAPATSGQPLPTLNPAPAVPPTGTVTQPGVRPTVPSGQTLPPVPTVNRPGQPTVGGSSVVVPTQPTTQPKPAPGGFVVPVLEESTTNQVNGAVVPMELPSVTVYR